VVEKRFKIHEVATMLGISKQSIRNYEKSGVFLPSQVDDKGWRYYTEDDINKLKAYYMPLVEKPK
jgi:DNA-binding transcriptional MerR regulator